MPNNYVLLERTELNASAASVTFANIPQTGYTDLKIVISCRTNASALADDVFLAFNGSTSTFTGRYLQGTGASALSGSYARFAGFGTGNTATSSTFSNQEIYIPNYTSANNKSYSVDSVSENNGTTGQIALVAGLWSTGTAISSIAFTPVSGTAFLANSTFSLYGIAALGTTPTIAPKASGGNRIDNDGTYWYHTFTSSGSFTPQVGLTCDVLVIAGGGGGAGSVQNLSPGGGGAGGVLAFASQAFTTNQTVTIGAGGAGGLGSNNPFTTSNGVAGSASTIGALTATVGGGRGGGAGISGGTGGSGGGGGNFSGAGGAATSGQGNAGGAGSAGGNTTAGSGGGAGAAGTTGGAGGAGVNTYTNWGSFSAMTTATSTGVAGFFAGGGGGASSLGGTAGGSGGGGAGNSANATNATSGTVNTGSGGGAHHETNLSAGAYGGSGGSGIIIVRYPI